MTTSNLFEPELIISSKLATDLTTGDLIGSRYVNKVIAKTVGTYNVRIYIEDVETGSRSCWRYSFDETLSVVSP
jgi:hypothetical protein